MLDLLAFEALKSDIQKHLRTFQMTLPAYIAALH